MRRGPSPLPKLMNASPPVADFIANHPALDFHNTLAWSTPDGVNERLRTASDLVRWCRTASIVTSSEAAALQRRAERNSVEADRVIKGGRHLRKVLHDALFPLAHGGRVRDRDLDRLNVEVRRALGSLRLGESRGSVSWANDPRVGLSVMVHRLAWSAAQLLTSEDLARLRCCANPRCGWLFLDKSRNSSRKWCSMAECGSRAKARRYYRRRRRG